MDGGSTAASARTRELDDGVGLAQQAWERLERLASVVALQARYHYSNAGPHKREGRLNKGRSKEVGLVDQHELCADSFNQDAGCSLYRAGGDRDSAVRHDCVRVVSNVASRLKHARAMS